MELVVTPAHPAAVEVGSTRSRPLASEVVAGPALYDHVDHDACTAAIYDDHLDRACAACLVAAGRAADATARHYVAATGRLHG